MKPFFLTITIFFLTGSGYLLTAQELQQYRVQFTDKAHSHFRLDRPTAFLSHRALVRRKRQHIPLTDKDLPVSPAYVQRLRQSGVYIQHTSRWLNSALVIAKESDISVVAALPFVDDITYIGKHFTKKDIPNTRKNKRALSRQVAASPRLPNYYGFVEPQITMLNGDFLHQKGYKGEKMLIAVMDGGFTNVEHMDCFQTLHNRYGLQSAFDVVDGDKTVFESSTHGSKVLSVMAADSPGMMVGTAPAADYICLKTEDVRGEYRSEEFYWIVGLEYADSIGVDVINSSLGYSQFTDSTMNYTYADMDGQRAWASQYSDIAAEVGMIVVNAAGNAGDTEWKYVDTPADGQHVLSVGAVTMENEKANFSSFGPTADGRIKPDVVALGRRIGVASVFTDRVNASNGTSYAAPLVTGLVAALWQAFPDKTNFEIMEAVRQSSSQADAPNNEVGYGLPDFKKAYSILKNN